MKISRKRVEIKKDKPDFQNVRKLLKGLSGTPVCRRPYSESGGHVSPGEVKAIFFTGSSPDVDVWTTSLAGLIEGSGVKNLAAKVIQYVVTLEPGERFSDESARTSLEILADTMGYGTAEEYLTMSFWHAATDKKPEHLHLIACRINIRTHKVLTEHGGWYGIGLQKARAKTESLCGFTSSKHAGTVYKDEIFLSRVSAEYEAATGNESTERKIILVAGAIASDLRSGDIRSWQDFQARCDKDDVRYFLTERNSGRLRSSLGPEVGPAFWFPELSRSSLERRFGQAFPPRGEL